MWLNCPSAVFVNDVIVEGEYPLSKSKRISWQERSGVSHGEFPQFPTFRSEERQTAFKLCGWSFGDDEHSLEDYLKR